MNIKLKLSITITAFVVTLILIFKNTFFKFFLTISNNDFFIKNIKLIVSLYMGILILASAVCCYRLSKKKKRNPVVWTILGMLFNVWPLLILWYLPPVNKSDNK